MFHPVNGTPEETWTGFSWPAFFFGIIWMLLKGLYVHAVITLIIAVVTVGFAIPVLWIVYGFIGNGLHETSLMKKGYLTERQHQQRRNSAAVPAKTNAQPQSANYSIEKLTALAKLRESGALTQEEFDIQKMKLLGT